MLFRSVLGADAAGRAAHATLLGVRPEYVTLAPLGQLGAVPAVVTQAQDIGTYWLVAARAEGAAPDAAPIRARLGPRQAIPKVGETVWLQVDGPHTCFYKDDKLIAPATQGALQ